MWSFKGFPKEGVQTKPGEEAGSRDRGPMGSFCWMSPGVGLASAWKYESKMLVFLEFLLTRLW
jgi:hypothetical protein